MIFFFLFPVQYASEVFVCFCLGVSKDQKLRAAYIGTLRLSGFTPQAEGRPMETHRLRELPSETWSVVRYH